MILKKDYKPNYNIRDTERAIKFIKDNFEQALAHDLSLDRISAPLFVDVKSGLNDTLSGVERSIKFDILNAPGTTAEIVQSLAKWKRMALHRYSYNMGEGIYTDMNAIRRDDDLDNIHSIYVDQWDWEKIIDTKDRTIEYLNKTVRTIVLAIYDTLNKLKMEYPKITTTVEKEVFFITSQQLEDLYPTLNAKQREYEITKKHKTVFISQIGKTLKSGLRHDSRAPDYDDWSLNGDILLYNEVLDIALEISSMGIRVDEKSIVAQLEKANLSERLKYEFHSLIANGTLPLTMGGGIGQSRLCMHMLGCAHIGEVQASFWSKEIIDECSANNIKLL